MWMNGTLENNKKGFSSLTGCFKIENEKSLGMK